MVEKLTLNSLGPYIETFMIANHGVSYKLWDKYVEDRGWWNITTQEQNINDMENEIVSFVVNESVTLIILPYRQL